MYPQKTLFLQILLVDQFWLEILPWVTEVWRGFGLRFVPWRLLHTAPVTNVRGIFYFSYIPLKPSLQSIISLESYEFQYILMISNLYGSLLLFILFSLIVVQTQTTSLVGVWHDYQFKQGLFFYQKEWLKYDRVWAQQQRQFKQT